jgi:hypothetical protein
VIGQYQACNVILPAISELFNEKPKGTAWRTKPSAYIVANNDHAVHPDLERASAERMGATTYAVDNSHVPMLSQPDVVLTAIRNLTAAVQRAPAMAAVLLRFRSAFLPANRHVLRFWTRDSGSQRCPQIRLIPGAFL